MHQLSPYPYLTTLLTPLEHSESRFHEGGMYLAIVEPEGDNNK